MTCISYDLGYVCISKTDNVVERLQPTTFKTIIIPHPTTIPTQVCLSENVVVACLRYFNKAMSLQ